MLNPEVVEERSKIMPAHGFWAVPDLIHAERVTVLEFSLMPPAVR